MVTKATAEDANDVSPDATAYTPTESDDQIQNVLISWPLIARGLRGVADATKADDREVQLIADAISASIDITGRGYTLRQWQQMLPVKRLDVSMAQRATLAIALAWLCQCGRLNTLLSPADLDHFWSLIHDALLSSSLPYSVSRSVQGFFAIPLWSIIDNGNIVELFRLHVWLPDGSRGVSDLAIHSHQAFAQSWTLAGQGRNYVYKVEPADQSNATHAEFAVRWSDKKSDRPTQFYHDYKTHQISSTIVNTGKLVRITSETSEMHSRNMMYTVPAGVMHRSDIEPDVLRATIFIFDASRGFEQVAPVLGPIDRESYTQQRDAAGLTAVEIARMIHQVRSWETLYTEALQNCREAKWEEALQLLRSAVHLIEGLPHALHYRCLAQAEVGHIYRMLGRYKQASQILEDAIRDMPWNKQRVTCTGELAVVYRHMGRLEDAKRACEAEYAIGKQLNLRREVCRAVGNLGMVNYQLYLETKEKTQLALAMDQLTERVERARELKAFATAHIRDPGTRSEQMGFAAQQEAIALARLSLCYSEAKQADKAIQAAMEALEVTYTQHDPTKTAFSRFFYGRALLLAGKKTQALAVFNPPPNTCTPTIALCREPSDEHRGYIREMIEVGADMELRDEQGYSALDCAVYSGDTETQRVIENGLKLQYERRFDRHCYEAILRKAYREVVQDVLRPVFLRTRDGVALEQLRQVYAAALRSDVQKSDLFDGLKFIRFSDFVQYGRIPRSSDGLTNSYFSSSTKDKSGDFIVFMSYRWIAKDPSWIAMTDLPDDMNNTQYHRMLRALEEFLLIHPEVTRERLCVWLDFACVDQTDHSTKERGCAALLLNLAQCNALISLVDGDYYGRSWCCVEVSMVQTLQKAYGIHLWYEHIEDPLTGESLLRQGPKDLDINMVGTLVTYEADRANLLFLERQTRLLG